MNTTQNIQRIMAAAVIAVTAGLAFSSCAGGPTPDSDRSRASNSHIAERASNYLDQAERRAALESGSIAGLLYRDQAERRAGLGTGTVAGPVYRDQAERRVQVEGR